MVIGDINGGEVIFENLMNLNSILDQPNSLGLGQNWSQHPAGYGQKAEYGRQRNPQAYDLSNLAWLGEDNMVHTVPQNQNGPRMLGATYQPQQALWL